MISPVKIWRNQEGITKRIGKKGKILSFTIIRVGPHGFQEQIPYPVVVVLLDDGDSVVGQFVDWTQNDLRIGTRVEAVLRRVRKTDPEGVIPYGIKFRPIHS